MKVHHVISLIGCLELFMDFFAVFFLSYLIINRFDPNNFFLFGGMCWRFESSLSTEKCRQSKNQCTAGDLQQIDFGKVFSKMPLRTGDYEKITAFGLITRDKNSLRIRSRLQPMSKRGKNAIVFQMKLNCDALEMIVCNFTLDARRGPQNNFPSRLSCPSSSGEGSGEKRLKRFTTFHDGRRRSMKWNWKEMFLINLCKFRDESLAWRWWWQLCFLLFVFINRH